MLKVEFYFESRNVCETRQHKGHTSSPKKEIKNPDPAGNAQPAIPGQKAGILPVTPQRRTFRISHVNEKYYESSYQ